MIIVGVIMPVCLFIFFFSVVNCMHVRMCVYLSFFSVNKDAHILFCVN